MVRGEEVADKVIEALAVKIKAMEEVGKGFNADKDITIYDRLAVVLGTFSKKYIDRILEAKIEDADVKTVAEILEKHGVELTPEEVIVLSKARKFVAEKVKAEGLTVLEKMLDADVGMNSDQILTNRWFPLMMLPRFE